MSRHATLSARALRGLLALAVWGLIVAALVIQWALR